MFTMFMGLRKLRVLSLVVFVSGATTFSFPKSIGQLKQLRYFAFRVNPITNLTMPGAFTKLYQMQVVDFGQCCVLVFCSRKDMMNLVNLRHLISSAAGLDFPNVGSLRWLQMLPFFIIRKKKGYELHQLKHLNKLQGKLRIEGLENVESKEKALEGKLADKEKLTSLVLQWDKPSCSPEVQAEVLEGLCPSKYLERLVISGYDSMTLPNWMTGEQNSGPKNLQEIVFSKWSQQGPVPAFGAFTHLHSLKLSSCIWDSFSGNMEHLTSLKKLEIRKCMNMRSLAALPRSLEEFTVVNCSHEFMRSCITTTDPNCQKIEHIPKKTFQISDAHSRRLVPFFYERELTEMGVEAIRHPARFPVY